MVAVEMPQAFRVPTKPVRYMLLLELFAEMILITSRADR
jgi:hypothetical protein